MNRIPASKIYQVIGKKAKRNISEGKMIKLIDIT